jgi:hypothetical protein
VRQAILRAASLAVLLLVLLLGGCGGGGSKSCVITPVGSKLCGDDARVWCRQYGRVFGRTIESIARACAAAEGRTLHATVEVFFCTDQTCATQVTAKQIGRVRSKLESNPLVKSVKFVSKEQAFKEMTKKNPDLTKGIKENPLPDALEVTGDSGNGSAIAATLRPTPPGVERITYEER